MSTGIDYLDEIWNPVTGCSGKGCKVRDHCWAKAMVKRFPAMHGIEYSDKSLQGYLGAPIPFSSVQFHPSRLNKPLHWRKPRRIGVCFMGDLFDEQVMDSWLYQIYPVMVKANWHQYFVLTKQPKRMAKWLKDTEKAWQKQTNHIWHGVSITDQEDADRMIPELLKVPGKRWVSIEPMLGPVDLNAVPWKHGAMAAKGWSGVLEVKKEPDDFVYWMQKTALQWVVLGCESGHKRRPCPHAWMIDVVRQCKAAGLPVWVKQIEVNGKVSHNPAEWPEELRVREDV